MIVNKYQGNGGGGGGSYVLPPATANRLGGIKVGSGLTVENDGTLSASGGTYELPVASNQVLGGVKIGSGITIDANGVISAQGGSGEGNVKVYMYDELYSGDTYDHYDMSVPNEMEALAKSGTPVYVLYRGQNKSVYLELTTKTGNTLVFKGADGDGYYSFSLVKDEPWTTSEIGHSRNGDYEVVSQLPQRAQEGQLFYVPAHTGTIQYNGLTLTTNETENFIGHLYDANNNEKATVYISGTDFYWDWDNNGEINKRDDFYYKTDNQNKTFIFYAMDGWYITADNDTTTGETEGFSVQVTIAPATYIYTENDFRKEVVKIKINDFKGADYGFNSNSLYDYLQQFTEDELKQNFVFEHDGNYAKYEGLSENERYDFSVNSSPVVFPVGPPAAVPSYHVYANYDGSVSDDGKRGTSVKLPVVLNVNLANSGLSSDIGGLWVRICGDIGWGGSPVVTQIIDNNNSKLVGYTQNCWFRQAYDGDNSDWADLSVDGAKIFGCEWYQYGDKITAEWVVNSDGVVGGAPINWNVTSNAHSAADSTIPSNS